jgi:hypothetical protein
MKIQGPTLNGAIVVPISEIRMVIMYVFSVIETYEDMVACNDRPRHINTTRNKTSANDSQLRGCRHADGRTRTSYIYILKKVYKPMFLHVKS